ncbi:hypothetical protein SEA_FIZZLES_76 [Microbacterium phage Fizzles]|nr:hypothetical protein SEA_FIZZLES_76 [Microbacterium phage Fizzles]
MTSALTPYDRGVRAEPKPWATATGKELEVMPPIELGIEEDRFGKVDFDDDEGATLATVWLERADDGRVFLHVNTLTADEVAVIVHG